MPGLIGCRSSQTTMADLQSLRDKLQTASVDFQKIQADLSKAVEARQKLDAQLSENELVKKVRHRVLPTISLFS